MHTGIGGPTNASRGGKTVAKTNTGDEKPDELRGKRGAQARRVARKTDFFSNIVFICITLTPRTLLNGHEACIYVLNLYVLLVYFPLQIQCDSHNQCIERV